MEAEPQAKFPVGLAVAGLFLLTTTCFLILMPVFVGSRSVSEKSLGLSRIKKLAMGALIYSADNDDRLPLATSWTSSVAGAIGGDAFVKELFVSPGARPSRGLDFAYRKEFSGRETTSFRDVALQAMLFDSASLGQNPATDLGSLPIPGRYSQSNQRCNLVAFVDGSGRCVPDAEKGSLK